MDSLSLKHLLNKHEIMKAQNCFIALKKYSPYIPNAVENHKRSNQTVVKEKHAFIFYVLWSLEQNKRKEERNCRISSRFSSEFYL